MAISICRSRPDRDAIARVRRKARCVEAEHCTNFACAQAADQSFETGTVDSAACGPTKVVVDHLDIVKSPAARNVDKIILSALALKVVLDLARGRLSDVHHSFALEHCDPQAYLADVLERIHDHKINRIDELLPWK